jgi:peptide/nickel transport system ATP-binding protein
MEKGQSFSPVMGREKAQAQTQVKGQNQIMSQSQSHNNPAAPAQPKTLLEVKDLRVEYLSPKGPVRAVDGVSFSIGSGEVLGLAGESGSGKSTIAHALLRVLRPPALITGGEVHFKGKDVLSLAEHELEEFRWQDISMVFQSAMNSLNPVMRIGDQIGDVLVKHKKISKREARLRAGELLDIVNIDKKRLDSYPHELSGGMRQRAVIAMALALNPPMMIMDEPTTALDVVVQKEIMQQIEELKEKMGFSILFITHDMSLMVEFSNRIAIMYAGEIVEMAAAREIFENPLHPYTRGLISSFPPLVGPKRKMTGIPGAPPNMAEPPTGCRFHPRCTMCQPVEKVARPQLQEVLPGHWLAYHEGMPGGSGQ